MSLEAPGSRYVALQVSRVVQESHDAKSIHFDLPADWTAAQRARFDYQPGQFLTLRLPVAGRHVPRCYSMSSAPTLDAGLRVTVKRVKGGRGSNWICDHVHAGDVIEVMPPAGVFCPAGFDGDFLLAAGGSGITPMLSILRAVLAAGGKGRILLMYANRDERSVIFKNELQALASAHSSRLQIVHWLDSVQGIPGVAQLAEYARPMHDAQAFICGPAPFMDACVAALAMIAMAPEAIHVERFASLPDEEDSALLAQAAAANAPAAMAADADVEITLKGQLHRFSCAGNESVFEAAQRANLELPHACLVGLCASCRCQVESGTVHLRANDALDERDLSKGWTLACQALPTSPSLKLKFS
jgi:3-ketosteroid 9alpha-monooxygenase subunit B